MTALRYLAFLFCVNHAFSEWRWKRELPNCIQETTNCMGKFTCFKKMTAVLKDLCGESLGYSFGSQTFTRKASKCSLKCAEELNKFIKGKHGSYLMSCDCPNRDSTCLTMKSRIKKCIASGLGWPMNDTKPSCSEARKNCSKNEQCHKSMGLFLRDCSQLISGVKCTDDCLAAKNDFLKLRLGKILENECECDGVEEPFCRGIRAHYQALCLPISRVTKSVSEKLNATKGNNTNSARWNCVSRWVFIPCFLIVIQFVFESKYVQ